MGAVAAMQRNDAAPAAQGAQPARLRVDQVSLRYRTPEGGTFAALEKVSFEVPDQQFAVIVGPSGCGKSSLLYLTAGLSEPTEGDIYVGGQRVDGPGADRGMVFQSYTLFPWLTVRENVEFGLKRRGLPAAERKEIVDYYLNEVGLANFAGNYPKQLSGGMMQRVAIARALANDPQILLMDEPFGALDSQTRMQMQKLLLRVWDHSKKTVVFVTHDIDEAILLGDRVYVMGARPGRIKRILDVPIERPRSLDMVMDRQFIEMKREILGLLHDDLEEAH
ncbi:NitT/TauT family transport system ATP-binding protein [Pseudomonas citronellolis]|uniref:ABC transporter ATP-binding protein n=1 Tax=Pseudomonas citronellolis TaxID=53408 RepID=A0A1A9KL44_9PSED|nr:MULTISPECIES: ABC transporter ATP-binding protein [Pseudomonas]ANI18242.1 sulfonate ABC transporter ATP-binding protein [Pseudomonas citronellolis]KES23438.1 sulfonate ABC transporter ATP-binding protein [Pseudomonas sp. AAC]KRV66136.1 sulfonate ABC transporter ATP-binding protein [Pseudomonas citronellolis]KRW77877.1 sulfonate ABC transporter ATP-binding protein [Pseudomonas citronellolis]MBH3435684.1 ABC transporter ATP-binding protein [Pseudomonas citronellolis]